MSLISYIQKKYHERVEIKKAEERLDWEEKYDRLLELQSLFEKSNKEHRTILKSIFLALAKKFTKKFNRTEVK